MTVVIKPLDKQVAFLSSSKLNHANNHMIAGVGLAVLSNALFGLVYLYSHWLTPLTGTQVFLWRMVAMWLGLFVLMGVTGSFSRLAMLLSRFSFKQWAILVLPTPILASQLWLFMWAPVNGQAVNTAMGYFLFPLIMVLVGGVVFGEKLNRWQQLAIALAGLGVVVQMWQVGEVSWTTLWVCLTYPIYYAVRRWQGIPALMGLFVDLTLIAPVALGMIIWQQTSLTIVTTSPLMVLLIGGLGFISAIAMQSNLKASVLLPMNTFGMLSYLEPALMFLLSIVVLHEAVSREMIVSFGLIWAGVIVMIVSLWRTKHPGA